MPQYCRQKTPAKIASDGRVCNNVLYVYFQINATQLHQLHQHIDTQKTRKKKKNQLFISQMKFKSNRHSSYAKQWLSVVVVVVVRLLCDQFYRVSTAFKLLSNVHFQSVLSRMILYPLV